MSRAWGLARALGLAGAILLGCGEDELALNPIPAQKGGTAGAGPAGGQGAAASSAGRPGATAGTGTGGGSLATGGASNAGNGGGAGDREDGQAGANVESPELECARDADCDDERPRCLTARHVCVACIDSTDCPSLADLCDSVTRTCTRPCSGSEDCTGEEARFCSARLVCVECLEDGDCDGDRARCNPTTNQCRGCLSDADCESDHTCNRTRGECEDAPQ